MSNRTVKDAHAIKGSDPQHLIEKIIRSRIHDCKFWKEECFGLTAELLVDKAIELKFIGGVCGSNIAPCAFLCLVLKMLQIQPEKDIIIEFIKNDEFKYVRALGVVYLRLAGTSLDCYKYLEPIYNDYRKLKRQNRSGQFEIVHMDELIDELLRGERVCDVILPRIQNRQILEELNQLELRVSALEDELDDAVVESERQESPKRSDGSRSRGRSKERQESPKRSDGSRSRARSRGRSKERRRGHRERRNKDKDYRSSRWRKSKDDSREGELDREIGEANALRAELGMAPLRI